MEAAAELEDAPALAPAATGDCKVPKLGENEVEFEDVPGVPKLGSFCMKSEKSMLACFLCFLGWRFSFNGLLLDADDGTASISKDCFSRISVIPRLSASSSHLNLSSSSSSFRKYRSTRP